MNLQLPLINLPFAEVDIEKVTELHGFNSINDRYVYRYRPESASKRDLIAQFETGLDAKGDLLKDARPPVSPQKSGALPG